MMNSCGNTVQYMFVMCMNWKEKGLTIINNFMFVFREEEARENYEKLAKVGCRARYIYFW